MHRMPYGFGPVTGPRRGPDGDGFECKDTPRSTTLSVSYETDAAQLAAILPECFELGAEPIVTVSMTDMRDLEWLAGRGYSMLGVSFPAVYRGTEETVRGPFLSVLWENMADPILTGREELGFAKVFCNLPDAEILARSASCSADWDGFKFMSMQLQELEQQEVTDAAGQRPFDGVLHYKYIPKTGEWGNADVAYPVISPAEMPNRKIVEHWTGIGEVEWFEARWEDMPTQYNIVNRLAGLEVVRSVGAALTKTTGGKDLRDQRRLR